MEAAETAERQEDTSYFLLLTSYLLTCLLTSYFWLLTSGILLHTSYRRPNVRRMTSCASKVKLRVKSCVYVHTCAAASLIRARTHYMYYSLYMYMLYM